jgi:hypothetical protein
MLSNNLKRIANQIQKHTAGTTLKEYIKKNGLDPEDDGMGLDWWGEDSVLIKRWEEDGAVHVKFKAPSGDFFYLIDDLKAPHSYLTKKDSKKHTASITPVEFLNNELDECMEIAYKEGYSDSNRPSWEDFIDEWDWLQNDAIWCADEFKNHFGRYPTKQEWVDSGFGKSPDYHLEDESSKQSKRHTANQVKKSSSKDLKIFVGKGSVGDYVEYIKYKNKKFFSPIDYHEWSNYFEVKDSYVVALTDIYYVIPESIDSDWGNGPGRAEWYENESTIASESRGSLTGGDHRAPSKTVWENGIKIAHKGEKFEYVIVPSRYRR